MPDQNKINQPLNAQEVKQPLAAKQQAPAQVGKPAIVQAPQSVSSTKLPEKKQFGRRKNGVLFVARQQCYFYVEGMQNVATMLFTPDVIADLDVIDEELLKQKIAQVTQQQQIPPANFIVVLANTTLFSKQITATDISQKKVDEEKFLNTIPFEIPAVRSIIVGSNTYIVVANRQLFGSLSNAFVSVGSEFSVVLPEFLFGKELNLASGLTVIAALAIMKKAQELRAYSFIRKEVVQQGGLTEDGEVGDSKLKLQMHGGKSNRMFVISGVLVMVVGVLISAFLLFQQSNATPPQKAVILEAPTPAVPSPTAPVLEGQLATESASPSTPSAAVQGETSSDITIQYTHDNGKSAYLLAERLRKLGFQKITSQDVLAKGDSQIAFKSSVSDAIENRIVAEVEKQIGAVSMQRMNAISDDIVIFIGNEN